MERFKAMRKWFVLLLMCMSCSTLPSCSDDDNDMRDVAVSPERLPKVSKDFLSEYYHGVKISSVVIDYDDNVMVYDVDLANGHDVTFGPTGEWVEVDAPEGETIPSGIVPEIIVNYLDEYYLGYGVNDITKTGLGYEVELVNNLDLVFDSQGNFLYIENL